MAAGFHMRIKPSEFSKLQKKFDRLVVRTRTNVVKKAVRDASKPALNDMRSRAPRDTGSLKKAIKLKVRGYRRDGMVIGVIGVSRTKYPTKKGTVQPSLMAHLIEYGTKDHGPKKKAAMGNKKTGEFFGTKVSGTPARPFVRPTFDSKKSGMESDCRRLIGKGVENLARATL